jgi:hypothetical protein
MIKYYFGYDKCNGLYFPHKWVEDRGQSIGGISAEFQRTEIQLHDYNFTSLTELVRRYPRKVDDDESSPPG